MKRIQYYLGFLALLLLASTTAVASGIQISVRQSALQVVYGQYAEIEINAEGVSSNVDFEITGEMEPVGMQLSPINSNSVLLHGVPEFLDRWCFLIKASANSETSVKRVCLISDQNEKLNHPTFSGRKYLVNATEDKYYSQEITAKTSNGRYVQTEFVYGSVPEGIDISSAQDTLTLSGRTDKKGVYEFVVQAHAVNANQNAYAYKQFQLEVDEEKVERYQCDRGYYFDDQLGYCVPNSGVACGSGTFYDPDTRSCVSYRTPSNVTCRFGYYYDHFQFRCFPVSYQRCPYNYEYDSYYGRCVRLPYTCSFGYRYSYSQRECVYMGSRSCGYNSYYSSYYGRCMPSYGYCGPGSSWDYRFNRCRMTRRHCGSSRYWDPYQRSCRTRYRSCRAGYRYDLNHGCVRRPRNISCGRGYHRQNGNGRCVPNHRKRRDDRRVKRPRKKPPVRRAPPRTNPRPPRKTPPRTNPRPPRKTPPRTNPRPPRKTPPRTNPRPPRKTPPRTNPRPPRKTPPRTNPRPPRKTPPRTNPRPPRKTPPRTSPPKRRDPPRTSPPKRRNPPRTSPPKRRNPPRTSPPKRRNPPKRSPPKRGGGGRKRRG